MRWRETTLSASKGVEIRHAQDEREVDEAYALASQVFGPNSFTARASKSRMRTLEPVKDLRDVMIGVGGGEVIGLVRIVDRSVRCGATRLQVGGVTSVCVRPDFQGLGYGRALMEAALTRLRERGDALSIAFARRAVDGFYPKLGYIGLGCHPEMVVTLDSIAFPQSRDVQVKRGVDDQLLLLYACAYEESYRHAMLSFGRDARWWEQLALRLAPLGAPDGLATVILRAQPVGYFVMQEGRVIEAASIAGCQQAVAMGMLALAAEHTQPLALSLPLDHWAMSAFRSLNHTLKVRYCWDGGHMIRALDHSFRAALEHILGGTACETFTEEERALDLDRHEDARYLLLRLAGAAPQVDRSKHPVGGPLAPAPRVLQELPVWSFVDEF